MYTLPKTPPPIVIDAMNVLLANRSPGFRPAIFGAHRPRTRKGFRAGSVLAGEKSAVNCTPAQAKFTAPVPFVLASRVGVSAFSFFLSLLVSRALFPSFLLRLVLLPVLLSALLRLLKEATGALASVAARTYVQVLTCSDMEAGAKRSEPYVLYWWAVVIW